MKANPKMNYLHDPRLLNGRSSSAGVACLYSFYGTYSAGYAYLMPYKADHKKEQKSTKAKENDTR